MISGYLIPGLLPMPAKTPAWSEIGSRVRGTCCYFNTDKGFGFLRYLVSVDDLTITDTRESGCPYREASFTIFEFSLVQGREDKMEATDLSLTISYASQGNW